MDHVIFTRQRTIDHLVSNFSDQNAKRVNPFLGIRLLASCVHAQEQNVKPKPILFYPVMEKITDGLKYCVLVGSGWRIYRSRHAYPLDLRFSFLPFQYSHVYPSMFARVDR
ncbi:hypothetical protein CIPAW_05G133100 [Carya illinoinensis]|uniref:Uncharacterized protein n=1 Tax=Carya illinoinensis TaxID=32201 RepID=A0A8T1QIN1_CARIL|nr:hypothetical protein CIPAW_05G133100 [Carya illinoinensis]